LVAVTTPDGDSIAYEYDDSGIRVSSTINGETTDFLIDKNRPYAQVLEEFTSDQLQAFYVYGHDLISQTRNTEQDFYQVDGLGSTRALADEDGNVTDTYDYEAFGELIDGEGDSENHYRYAGEQFDEVLNEYYLRQRFYNTDTGRFTRRDTYEGNIANPLELHKYIYGASNPVTYTDPSGLIFLNEVLSGLSLQAELNKADKTLKIEQGKRLVVKAGCIVVENIIEEAITQGVYLLTVGGIGYVGQTNNFPRRIVREHAKRFGKELDEAVRIFNLPGFNKSQRELFEQLVIDELGGKGELVNSRNPVSSSRLGSKKFKDQVGKIFKLC